MNREEARQAAIEWCVRQVQEALEEGINPTAAVTEKEDLFLGQIIIGPCVDNIKYFPFREIKAPPRGTFCLARDYADNKWDITKSSGKLDEDGWLISDEGYENSWKYWQVLKPVNSPYNHTGDTENDK